MGRGRDWMPDEVEELSRLRESGKSAAELAQHFDRSIYSIRRKVAELGVIVQGWRNPNLGVTRDVEVRRMAVKWRDYLSAQEIADMCGVSRNSIVSHWRRALRDGEIKS